MADGPCRRPRISLEWTTRVPIGGSGGGTELGARMGDRILDEYGEKQRNMYVKSSRVPDCLTQGAALQMFTRDPDELRHICKCGKRSVEVSSLTSQSFVITVLGNQWV